MELSTNKTDQARLRIAAACARLKNAVMVGRAAYEALADHLDEAMSAAKAADSILESTTKDDAFTEGQQGQQLVGYNLDGKPKKNTDGTVDSKTQSQIAFLLSDGAPLSEEQKKKLKDELQSGEIKIVPDKKILKGQLDRTGKDLHLIKILPNEKVLKGRLDRTGDDVRLFVPFTKVLSFNASNGQDAVMVEGCVSVSDFLDDQGDVLYAAALQRAFSDWGSWGNIRLQHMADHPIRRINSPAIGKRPAGVQAVKRGCWKRW
jgi:hypothetical protein